MVNISYDDIIMSCLSRVPIVNLVIPNVASVKRNMLVFGYNIPGDCLFHRNSKLNVYCFISDIDIVNN